MWRPRKISVGVENLPLKMYFTLRLNQFIILQRVVAWEGDYEMGHGCACVHPLVCHAVFSKIIAALGFLC